MRRLRWALLSMLATLLLGGNMATTAAAELDSPELLPFKEGTQYKVSGGAAKLETDAGAKVEVEKVSGKCVAGKTSLTGTCDFDLEGTLLPATKEKCKSLQDTTAGTVLVGVNYTLVFDTKPETGTSLGAGLLLTISKGTDAEEKEEEVHFTCGIILILLKGSVLALVKLTNTSTKELTLELKKHATKVGDNAEESWFLLVEGKFKEVKMGEAAAKAEMLLSLNNLEGKYKLESWEMTNGKVSVAEGTISLDA